MLDIELTHQEIGIVARFKRQRWSGILKRVFTDTDLIMVIDPAQEQNLLLDFHIYRQLPEDAQQLALNKLRNIPRYTGRMLTEEDLPPEAVSLPVQEVDPRQLSIF